MTPHRQLVQDIAVKRRVTKILKKKDHKNIVSAHMLLYVCFIRVFHIIHTLR